MEVQGLAVEDVFQKDDREDMRIGILTFHRAHNYGAVLQCYALQEILRHKGHEVTVVDYRQTWIEEFYKVFSIKMIRRTIGNPGEFVSYMRKNLKKFLLAPCRARNFRSFRDRFLQMSSPCTDGVPQEYDCYFIGSDQLWSLHCLGGVPDRIYMGDFIRPEGSRLIGYAISADLHSIEAVSADLPALVAGFSEISMRERKVAELVSQITGRSCDVCVDPTLLTTASMWDDVIDRRWRDRKYVLIYEVRRLKENKGLLRRKAEELASKIGGCPVIDLSDVSRSVRDFVSLFKYAEYVVTTSFHGTVFSLLFETPFYVLPLWNGYDLRYVELLQSIGAGDRIVSADTVLEPSEMDFAPLMAGLEQMRHKSLTFIDKALRP